MNEDVQESPMGTARWAEALTWHVTLRESADKDLTYAVGREWQQWHADPENQRIFDRVSRLLADRDLYRRCRGPTRAELEADGYDLSIPIAEWRKIHSPRLLRKQSAAGGHRWRWLFGGFAVAAMAAISVLVIRVPLRFWSSTRLNGPIVYQTKRGELRDVQLPDGSSIVLGGRTELSVAFSAQRRSVKLIEGQAWFEVAHLARRPFIVDAGSGTITDVGTAFVVTRDADRVVVAVTQGAVDVTAGPISRRIPKVEEGVTLAPVLSRIRVTQGEELAFTDKGSLSAIKQTDTHAATAWTAGRLTFDDVPLRYVVESVNRYSSRPIAVTASAGVLRFSGIIFDSEIDDWLQGLEKIFPVTVEEHKTVICVHLRNSAPTRGSSDLTCTSGQ